MSRGQCLACGLFAITALLSGCSEGGPPRVVVKGKLLHVADVPVQPDTNGSVTVIFLPQPETGRSYVGYLAETDGSFRITDSGDRGIPSGQYRVRLDLMAPKTSAKMQEIGRRFGSSSSPILVEVQPQQDVTLVIHRKTGSREEVPVTLRIDTPIEIDYYQHGGILPYVLRQLIQA